MDLSKSGSLLRTLRKSKGITQKELANKLGVVPKTVSKWETGHGFPDVTLLPALADALGVSERSLLCGSLTKNKDETGNMKRTKFYACPLCGSLIQGTGEYQLLCCGKPLPSLQAQTPNEAHTPTITEIEDDFYIEFPHEMSKAHYISFLAYVGYDRVLTVRLYPEQNCEVRIPKAYGGKLVYYCNAHGLFEYRLATRRSFSAK